MVTRNRGNRDDVDIYNRGKSMSSTAQKESVCVCSATEYMHRYIFMK